ncbi:P-loop containing nucleoside triphosphate hydrolase protein [Phyllosticta citricarpa]
MSSPADTLADGYMTPILERKKFNVLVASESPLDKKIGFCLSAIAFAFSEYHKQVEQGSGAIAPRPAVQGPAVVVLAPTRENALQTFDVLKALAHLGPVRTTLAIGGHPMGLQIGQLSKGCDAGLLIVDESQRLLADPSRSGMDTLRARGIVDAKTIFTFTSNFHTEKLQKRVTNFLKNDIRSLITKHPRSHAPRAISRGETIVQRAPREIHHFQIIRHILNTYNGAADRFIIFAKSTTEVETLYAQLRRVPGLGLVVLLGAYSQTERDMFLQDAERAEARVILTTDAFAAGLLVDGVRFVVQTYLPRPVAPLELDARVLGQVERHGHAGVGRFGRYAWHLSFFQEDENGKVPEWPIVTCAKVWNVVAVPQWQAPAGMRRA